MNRPAFEGNGAALLVLSLAGILGGGGPAAGHEHAPRVVSPHVADLYSMRTFAAHGRWKDLRGDAKVYEVFRYLTDPRTGLYPLGAPAREGPDDTLEYGMVRDPVKMLNVYPMGHCGTLGPTMAGIIEDMGIGPARTLILPGWGHVASEAFYDGAWHYLDLDVRAAFVRDDGSLASMEEAKGDPDLWKRSRGPLFFPLDDLESVRRAYAATRVERRHRFHTGGHAMDYVLRRGESFRRWWKPQGGRWNHHPSYGERPFPRSVIEAEPRGPKSKHPSFTVHTHGNGRFLYRPNLAAPSLDFEDGVHEKRNVRPGASGLTLESPGTGHAVLEVRSPYVIVPLVGDLDTVEDDREASVATVDAAGASLHLSLDNGLTWKGLEAAGRGGREAVDLSGEVSGRYGYLLKVVLSGEPEKAVLRSLSIATWVQLHPASLPSLRRGKNRLQYKTGDHHGLPTHVLEIRTDGSDREEFLKPLLSPPADFDPARGTRRAIGPFIARVEAPSGSRVAWFSGGGSFATHQGEASSSTRNSMAYAVGEPRDFKEFYRAEVPPGNGHWHYNADVEVKLDRPERAVFLRYVGDPGVNNLRIYAHCLRDEPCPSSPVVITHAFRLEGLLETRTFRIEGPGSYEVEVDGDPEDEYVEISVPGDEG